MRVTDGILIALALLLGAGSMLLLGAFLWGIDVGVPGPRLPGGLVLVLDALLCLLFFLQHSGMVRRGFRARLARRVDPLRHGVIYAIASGVALATLLLFWQPSERVLYAASGPGAWAIRSLWVLALACAGWGWWALRGFDPLGVTTLAKRERGRGHEVPPLVERGPYRFVRHPLYAAFLVLAWAVPVLPLDRLLFNVLWTIWIVVGTRLEERDLVAVFGDDYRAYQRRVPMLLPRPR